MDQSGFDEIAKLLRSFSERFGDTAFTDRRRLVSLLADALPEARRDIKVVGAAVDERVFAALGSARPGEVPMEIERQAAKLENGLGLRPDVAVPMVRACAYALQLGPLPSEADGMPRPAAPPPPRDDGWIGLSEPVSPGAAPAAPGPAPAASVPAKTPAAGKTNWVKIAAAAVPIVIGLGSAAAYFSKPSEPERGVQRPAAAVPQPGATPSPLPAPPSPPASSPVSPPSAPVVKPAPAAEPAPPPPPPPPAPPRVAQQPVSPPAQPSPQPSPQIQTPPPQPQAFGDEMQDFGIPPQSAMKAAVGNPTPLSIPGARTVTTVQVMNELRQGHRMVLIDSLQDNHPATLSGAVHLPFSGQYGTFNDQAQALLATDLVRLTDGHREIPLVFFCQGVRCWESYNAALRARAAGFPNVFWYRGGLAAWREAGLPMQPLSQ